MTAYIMFFESKKSNGTLSEIADTEKEVIKYCVRVIAEGEYKLKKILKIKAADNSVVECELRFLANEFYLDAEDLPF